MEIINFLSDNDSDEEAKCIQIEEDGSPFQVVDTCTITIEGGGVRTETKGKKKKTPRQIIWKKNNLIIPESQKEFKGCTEILHLPPKEVRQDAVAHWPKHANDRQRSKMPGCHLFTYVMCQKCGVALCFKKNNECFTSFHTK